MRRVVGVVAGLMLSGAAVAEVRPAVAPESEATWWVVGATADAVVFVDASTIRRSSNEVTFWERWVEPAGKVKMTLRKVTVHCVNETAKTLTYIEYGLDGKVSSNEQFDFPKPFDLAPGSVGRSQMNFVCADPSEYAQRSQVEIPFLPTADFLKLARLLLGQREPAAGAKPKPKTR